MICCHFVLHSPRVDARQQAWRNRRSVGHEVHRSPRLGMIAWRQGNDKGLFRCIREDWGGWHSGTSLVTGLCHPLCHPVMTANPLYTIQFLLKSGGSSRGGTGFRIICTPHARRCLCIHVYVYTCVTTIGGHFSQKGDSSVILFNINGLSVTKPSHVLCEGL